MFGKPVPPSKTVEAVAVEPKLADIARSLPSNVRFGTSSWSFPGWEGLVYDRKSSKQTLARVGLQAYAKHPLLNTVGIDRTYYRPVTADELATYRQQVPEDFRFLVKATRDCCSPRLASRQSNPLFLDPHWTTDQVVQPFMEGLEETGERLVFQFPPLGPQILKQPERFLERLQSFFAELPRGPSYAVELRDESLLFPNLATALTDQGVHICYSLHSRMPPLQRQRELLGQTEATPLTARWMLHSGLGYEAAIERYEPFDQLVDEDPGTRSALTAACEENVLAGHSVLVIVNNKAEGSSPLSVFRLAEALSVLLD